MPHVIVDEKLTVSTSVTPREPSCSPRIALSANASISSLPYGLSGSAPYNFSPASAGYLRLIHTAPL